jgi:hypothetical protein
LSFIFTCLKIIDFVAQLVEQYTFNVWALGSSPSEITLPKKPLAMQGAFLVELLVEKTFFSPSSLPSFTKSNCILQIYLFNFSKWALECGPQSAL